jgi:hypothetical protein
MRVGLNSLQGTGLSSLQETDSSNLRETGLSSRQVTDLNSVIVLTVSHLASVKAHLPNIISNHVSTVTCQGDNTTTTSTTIVVTGVASREDLSQEATIKIVAAGTDETNFHLTLFN